MSFTDDYLALRKKRKKNEQETPDVKKPLYVNKTAPLYRGANPVVTMSNKKQEDDYAPVGNNQTAVNRSPYMQTVDFSLKEKELETLSSLYNKASELSNKITQIDNRPKYAAMAQDDAHWNKEKEKLQSELDAILQGYGSVGKLQTLVHTKKQELNLGKLDQKITEMASVMNEKDFRNFAKDNKTVDDDLYAFINNRDNAQAAKFEVAPYYNNAQPMTSTGYGAMASAPVKTEGNTEVGLGEYTNKGYHLLTEEEKSIFNYHWAKNGKKKAMEWLDSLQIVLNDRMATAKAENMEGDIAKQLLFGVNAGLDQFSSGLTGAGNAVTGDDEVMIPSVTQMTSAKVREGMGGVGKFAYDLTTTTANMLPSILASTAANFIVPGSGAVVGTLTMGTSAGGNAYQEMINNGYDVNQARTYGVLVGGSEAILQKALGGITKLSGGGGGVFQNLVGKALPQLENGLARFAVKFGSNMLDEGLEEGIQEVLDPIFQRMVGNPDADVDWGEVAYSALLGTLSGGVMESTSVPGAVKAYKNGIDPVTGLTTNEKKVVDKVYEDRVAEAEKDGKLSQKDKNEIFDKVVEEMDKGYISTDTIEEVLGGDTYKSYKDTVDSEDALSEQQKTLTDEYNALNKKVWRDMTGEEMDRREELKAQLADLDTQIKSTQEGSQRNQLKSQLGLEVSKLVKSDRLSESYNERARRGQVYEADLTQYDAKQRETIQKAIDSGILNNTNRTHEFVDIIAKISADRGVPFDFVNNQKLKESGFAVDGKTVNGYYSNGTIGVNIDSPKAWQSTVGHEITHVLEGTDMYNTLQEALFEYAKTKGEYDTRLKDLTELYKNIKDADVKAELTSDLVGDYLFTDKDFINNLSTKHRNIFEKVYDEIKYLYKVATAGSKEARELEKVKKAFEDAYRADSKASGDTKYSISGSDGKQLSKEQQDYFKDSKVRDENGNLKVMYHGTPNGDFTIFKDGTYFTDSKEYADKYQNPGASSISTKKTASNPKTYKVYLDIKKPFDITDAEARRIYIEDYIKGGNAVGINPYLSDAEYGKIQTIDWTEGEDLREFLIDNGYDYDGLVLDEGATGGYGEEVKSRGTSYVVFSPEQVKNVDNQTPTSDPDIRFSLSDPVEQTKDLMALHNLTEEKLLKSLKLGGLPMPSIAVAKANDGHGDFGEISLVLPKETIDPKSNRNNKLYSGDAWTPTYPSVDYKVDEKVLRNISKKLYNLVPSNVLHELGRISLDADNMADTLNRWGGDVVTAFGNNDALKYAYLLDNGEDITLPMKEKRISYGSNENGEIIRIAEAIPADEIKQALNGASAEMRKLEPRVRQAVAEYWQDTYGDDPTTLDLLMPKEELSFSDLDGYLSDALRYHQNGVEQTVDSRKAKAVIAYNANQKGYENWLKRTFDGIVEKEGIRNNKDYFTPSGNRRSFEALHYEHNLENVIKAMREKGEKGIGVFGGGSIFGASTTEFSSVEEMKQASDRLQKVSDDEYQAMRDEFSNRFFEIAGKLPKDKNSFMATDDAASTLVEAVAKYNTRSGIANYLRRELNGWATYSDQTVDDLIELVRDIRNMPTGYFEAKPQRAVGFDEVGVFVIPRNADVKLKQELLNRGYSIAEYDPDVEGDRQKVVNQFEEYKFSLSNVGEQTKYGNFSTPANELRLEQEIAPVAETDDSAERLASLSDADVPPETDTYYGEEDDVPVAEKYEAIKPKPSNEPRMVRADSVTEKGEKTAPGTRKELHQGILESIKSRFAEKGLDFDGVLKNAKNLSTFATVDNTPQRVMEKSLGYKGGQILSDLTVNQVAQNETEGIKWLNSFTDRKSGLLAQISKQYNIKPGSKESAAAQMYAEGFYVDDNNNIIQYSDAELAKDFPDAKVQQNIKGLARDARIRKIYDDTLAMINESRTRNAYPEIPRLDNYFLHFRAMEDTFSRLGLPFNPNDIRAKDLPTDLNGVTADLKPGQPYFASAMHRTGKRTSFDLLGGLEKYLTSAKNQIYHIDDIQTLRALRNYVADTYGQANGLEGLDVLTEEEAQERIEKVYNSHLSTFAKFLNEEANILAGKTALIDRGLEGVIGRRGITFLDTVNKQVGSNMVGWNLSSSLTNFLPVAQTFAKTNKVDFVKAFGQTVANKVGSVFGRSDGFAENSPVIIRRKGADRFYRTPYQKVGDAGYVFMSAVDDISTELIARTKYNELTRKKMDSQQAHYETDKWVSRLMGDRSLGQMPQLYNSKMLGLVTKFQLEVRNQLDSQFYDTIQETKASNEEIQNGLARNAKTAAKVASTFVQLAVVQHLFGKAFESVAGYNPAFDIISVLIKTFGWDDEDESEDTVLDNIEQGFFELLEDLPYTSTLTGGRIPIESALPIEQFVTGKDQYGNEKSRWETLGEVAPYYVLPSGYGQIKKSVQGLSMFSYDHPIAGSYTDSGNLRFPVDDTLANRVQAGIFGQYASSNARDYFNNDIAPLKEKQIQEFIDVGMTIHDYWDYREGLSGLKTLAEKADYIDSLDLTNEQKNVLINNIADREEDIDMSSYGDYDSFEEFDFATKNPEKYSFFQNNGISYEEYASADEKGKREYSSMFDWADENPGKYTMSKAISDDFLTFWKYKSELYDLKADKDENGKSISGSRKEKVIDYINNLDIDYGSRIILFRSMYDSKQDKADYNMDIIDYLNSREDISYEEMATILKELGFKVSSDGTITWD